MCLNLTAQNGGLEVKHINASGIVTVGTTASETVVITDQRVSLPPLTNSRIQEIPSPRKGMIVYSTDSDVLLSFDGVYWRRTDGQNDEFLPSPFYDQDSNLFYGVIIGDQCWMDRNVVATTFPSGEPIPKVTLKPNWSALSNTTSDAAYCYYGNNTVNQLTYGNLYTYAAAIAKNWTEDNADGQGICPDGWHLPSNQEWTELQSWLTANGHSGTVATALKAESGWSGSGNGSDDYGFTALPGGNRSGNGTYQNISDFGHWWTATNDTNYSALRWRMGYNYPSMGGTDSNMGFGFSVRCLRNSD